MTNGAYKTGTPAGPVRQWAAAGFEFVTSSPIPLHTARIARTAGADYVVRMISLPFNPVVGRYGTLEAAREGSSRAVNARTVSDMKSVYSPAQRIAMGQQKCPKRLGNRLCGLTAVGYSVWCEHHPQGKAVTDV